MSHTVCWASSLLLFQLSLSVSKALYLPIVLRKQPWTLSPVVSSSVLPRMLQLTVQSSTPSICKHRSWARWHGCDCDMGVGRKQAGLTWISKSLWCFKNVPLLKYEKRLHTRIFYLCRNEIGTRYKNPSAKLNTM